MSDRDEEKKSIDFWSKPNSYFYVLVAINFLNYLDRGIIPGATNEFNTFIKDHIDTDTPDLYLGLLQSSFIVGFCIASIFFGNAVHKYRPFFLCGVGMSIWTLAVFLCGLSYFIGSYEFLVFARMLSGMGEASLQCTLPVWITRYAPAGKSGTWLAYFYTAIPVGTATGYAYSASIATTMGWQWAFWMEGMAMAPLAFFLFRSSSRFPKEDDMVKRDKEEHLRLLLQRGEQGNSSLSNNSSVGKETKKEYLGEETTDIDDSSDDDVDKKPSILEEIKVVTSSTVFCLVTLGYAAQTGVLIGLSTFGSAFIMGLGYFDKETDASFLFGVVISLAGILGTPLGGYLQDTYKGYLKKQADSQSQLVKISDEETEEIERYTTLYSALIVITGCASVGSFIMIMLYFTRDVWGFMIVVLLGTGIIFATASAINIACMMAVERNSRSFAIAFMTVIMHLFGDVPSPIIVGAMKDSWAPGCVGDDDNIASSDSCRDDKSGIRLTMFVVCLWLLWTVMFFGISLFMTIREKKQKGETNRQPLLAGSM